MLRNLLGETNTTPAKPRTFSFACLAQFLVRMVGGALQDNLTQYQKLQCDIFENSLKR